MSISGGSLGSLFIAAFAVAAVAALAAAWAWQRQRRQMAELQQRLEASEHSRLGLQVHMQQVDDQLASVAEKLCHQQLAMSSVPNAGDAAEAALLKHLGDPGPAADSRWIDTEPSAVADDAEPTYPAFADTQPVEFTELPGR